MLFIFLISLLQAAPTRIIDIQFDINPKTVSVGQPALISWKAIGAQSVYLSGVGKVEAQGVRTAFPDETAQYFVLAGNDAMILSKSIEVRVEGKKGGGMSAFLNSEQFEYQK